MHVMSHNWRRRDDWMVLLNEKNQFDVIAAYQKTLVGDFICVVGEDNYKAASESEARRLIYLTLKQRGYILDPYLEVLATYKRPSRFERKDVI